LAKVLKDINRFLITRLRWLEWDTERVPAKLRRKKFPQLFKNEKLIVARRAQEDFLKAVYDAKGEFYCDATAICAVPAHRLVDVHNRTLDRVDIRSDLLKAAQNSPNYDVAYLTALINCRWLSRYIFRTSRTGKVDYYPNDLREYPIAQADAETQSRIAHLVDKIIDAKAHVQSWRDKGHHIDETDIVLNPHPLLETWSVDHGDLIDAAGFLSYEIGGSITTIEREKQRVNFRQRPPSYVESPHDHVLDYLTRYLETNREMLNAVDASKIAQEIRIPRSPGKVKDFLDRLEKERQRVMLRWMVAAQYENLIDEWAFDLYDVETDRREELGGTLYTLEGVPDGVDFVSILDDAEDSPMRRVAFQLEGAWYYRSEEALPNAVLIWIHDGEQVTTKHGIVGDVSILLAG
jgi:hypothetical protein